MGQGAGFKSLVFFFLLITGIAFAYLAYSIEGNPTVWVWGGIATLLSLSLIRRIYPKISKLLFLRRISSEEHDSPVAVLVTDADGKIVFHNKVAKQVFRVGHNLSLSDALSSYLASPSSLLFQIESRLTENRWAKETRTSRLFEVDLVAKRAVAKLVEWRILLRKKVEDHTLGSTYGGWRVSIGRNSGILSAPEDFYEFLGKRPSSLKEVFLKKLPDRAGFCAIETTQGEVVCFVSPFPARAGRREMQIFAGPLTLNGHSGSIKTLPLPALLVCEKGDILESNSLAKGFLGTHSLQGSNLTHFLGELGQPVDAIISSIQSQPKKYKSEFARVKTTGDEKFAQVTFKPLEDNGVTKFLVILSDATELKSLEAQFVQSQKMQAIGQLAGGIAHDFNNLLTAITGHCDLLFLRHGQNDPDFGDLEQISQNANRAAALVGQLLAFSRKQTLRPKSLDLEHVLSEHTHLLNRLVGEKITLSLRHGCRMKPIRADRRQLEQVIMNLVVNARDALEGAGEIIISTEMRNLKSALIRDRVEVPAGEYSVISVKDHGCGMSSDVLQRIFEPFYTSKNTSEGTGLGLSTVYGIVKQTGGFIFVDSAVGIGSTFELYFPADSEESLDYEVVTEGDDTVCLEEKTNGVVLLVEDEEPVRAFAARALQLKGFSVIEAASAEDALDILEDDGLLVDVFVTDVVMPGSDGPTWVHQALKHRPKTKVVFVSGYADNRCDHLAEDIPNSVFLPKPFSLGQLTSTVANLH